MATVYSVVPGKGGGKLTKVIAKNDGVQDALDRIIFKAVTKAEARLEGIRNELAEDELLTHGASIDMSQGGVDRYLTLVDKANAPADLNPVVRNLNSALSIEVGRSGGEKEITVRDKKTGALVQQTVKWGAMDGLYILHDALGAKHSKTGKVKT